MTDMKAKYLKLAREHTQRSNTMTRDQAIPYISFCVDDAQSYRSIDEMPNNARLVGWQCGFEPMFVAVWSYLSDTQGNHNRLDDDEAADLARDVLIERGWFGDIRIGEADPDYIL